MTTTTLDTHPGLPEILAEERRHRARGRALRWGLALAAGAALAAAEALLGGRDVGPAPALRVEAVTRGDVVHEVSATGRLEARGTVSVGPEISGRIAAVDVDFNDHVRRGQVLARFDTAALQAQLDLARANLRTAGVALRRAELDAARTERERRRVEPLRAGGMVAAAELNAAVDAELQAAEQLRSARAQVELQRANLALAQTNREHAEIRAPIDGVVITRAVDPGQAVAAALQAPELFVLAEDLDSMRVIAAIDEADVGRVAPGQPAHFTVDAYPDEQFAADVFELHSAPIITQDVVTYEAVLTVANPGRRLRPGMTASVKVVTARAVGAVVVPNAALRFTPPGAPRPAHRGVWTSEAAAGLRFVPVELVVDDGTRSAVRGALHPGDAVVVGTREDAS